MRYIVTSPVEKGYAWWDVRDSQDEHQPNRILASFWHKLAGAEFLARNLAERLNKQNS